MNALCMSLLFIGKQLLQQIKDEFKSKQKGKNLKRGGRWGWQTFETLLMKVFLESFNKMSTKYSDFSDIFLDFSVIFLVMF